MAAAKYDIVLEQDSDFVRVFTWLDKDGLGVQIEGWGARLIITEDKEKGATALIDIREGAGITLGLDSGVEVGQIQIRIPASDINALFADNKKFGHWQLYLFEDPDTQTANIVRLLEGEVLESKSNIPTT